MTPAPSDDSRIEELIADVIDGRHEGVDRLDERCREHPQWANALREGVADLEAMGFVPSLDEPPARAAADDSEARERIGRYTVHGELGRGGMGVVHLARDPKLGRLVAIKRLPARLARHPDALARFEREARLLAALDHPNIAGIHSLEEDEAGPFLTLALIKGRTLAEQLEAGPIGTDDAFGILRQIAAALEAAHAASIVHRDLKPQNVIVDDEGRVRVLDFGLAKELTRPAGDDPPTKQTPTPATSGGYESRAGVLVGTPGYMSPEQVRAEPTDARTDLFAWGSVAYECLTGSPAFPGADANVRMDRTLQGPPDFARLPSDLDGRVRRVIERALAFERTDRPENMVTVRRAIDDAAARRSRTREEPAARRRGNVPEPWTRFIGRTELVGRAERLLSENRLVSLVGPGGAGKTRLSIEVARRHAETFDDVTPWWVDLSPLDDAALVPSAIASATAANESPGVDPLESVMRTVGDQPALIVFDNCEHVVAAASRAAAALLQRCPGLRLVATTRESLGVVGESVLRVSPLPLPEDDVAERGVAGLRQHDALALFEERGREARPGFELTEGNAVAALEICRRLDGLPLAIELAAARLAALSVEDLARRLADRIDWLRGRDASRQPRQQALHSLVDWSHELLDGEARTLFRRLAVFAGSASLEAIESVCEDDGLKSWVILDTIADLVAKSLVELDSSGPRARYRMLDTLREFALDRLTESGERESYETRHAEYYVAWTDRLAPRLEAGHQAEALAEVEEERSNLRTAITRSAERQDCERGMRVLGSAWRFYNVRGHWTEGRRLAEALLDAAKDASEVPARNLAQTLRCAGLFAMQQGDYDEAERYLVRGLETERQEGDRARIAAAVGSLAQLELRRGRFDEATAHFEEHLAFSRELGNDANVAMTLAMLGNVAQLQGDLERARPRFEESLELSERLGNRYLTAGTLHNLADIVVKVESDGARARELWKRALELNRELGNRPWEARNLMSLGMAAKSEGDVVAARRDYAAALAIHRALGDKEGLRDAVLFFGLLAADLGQHKRALRLIAAARNFGESSGLSIGTGPSSRVDDALAEVRTTLDPDVFRETHASGTALSIEEAVDYALDE